MIKTLLRIRFRAMLASLTAQGRQKKKSGKGTLILFAVLYLYVFAVVFGMMGLTFFSLAEPYHQLGLDWLYFAMAGLVALGFAIIGSVFTTQSQLYDAKDNALLLSMPIPPKAILLSRMVPLLAINLLFASLVMVPAMVVYAVFVEFSPVGIIAQLLGLIAVTFLAQAIACLLGWLLHLLLSKLNKSFASMLYMVVFLVLYFWVYSQAQGILSSMLTQSSAIANAFSTWVWPLYAMGLGCTGSILHSLVLPAVSALCFGAVYWFLSATFLRSAAATGAGRKKRRLDLARSRQASPTEAVIRKELKKFLGTPVYLTNMGLGILMTAALAVAGIIFREDILSVAALLPGIEETVPLLVCAVVSFTVSTMCISTPSVSLEGKNIWILKSLPLGAEDILIGKLMFHCRMTIPVSAIAGGVLAAVYGCSLANILLCGLIPGLLALLCGLAGMNAGLQWARLDYISEAYPCKQSMAVAVTMFGMMGVPLVFGLVYVFLLAEHLSPTVFLTFSAALLSLACFGLYRLMVTWGAKKWNSL